MRDLHDNPTETIPLAADSHGTIRVGGTRVTLDSLVSAFELGATPEQIVHMYPTVSLDDAYAVITYYLRHRNEVKAHLEEEAKAADALQAGIEARFPTDGIRQRLLARRRKESAPSG